MTPTRHTLGPHGSDGSHMVLRGSTKLHVTPYDSHVAPHDSTRLPRGSAWLHMTPTRLHVAHAWPQVGANMGLSPYKQDQMAGMWASHGAAQ